MLTALHAEPEWNVQPNLTKSMRGIQTEPSLFVQKVYL